MEKEMKLFEVLNRPVEWRLSSKSSAKIIHYEFEIGSNGYTVTFYKNEGLGMGVVFEMFFSLVEEDGTNVELEKGYEITNTGHAFQVFATVKSIVEDFVNKNKVNGLYFSAEEPSRIKLYDRFIKVFKNNKLRYSTSFSYKAAKYYVFVSERKNLERLVDVVISNLKYGLL